MNPSAGKDVLDEEAHKRYSSVFTNAKAGNVHSLIPIISASSACSHGLCTTSQSVVASVAVCVPCTCSAYQSLDGRNNSAIICRDAKCGQGEGEEGCV